MTEIAIQTNGLRKRYRGGVEALKGVDLKVKKGICFGLLGPNGAGKSTLVKCLLSIVRPTAGSATLNGIDVAMPVARRGVGYLPEGHAFPSYLTGFGVCQYFGRLAGLSGPDLKADIENKLALVGMSEWKDKKVTKYSKGMKQRVGLAQAMLGKPSIVFLDEPTDGLDPIGRAEVRDVIADITKDGTTVFFNSHLLSEVEMICDEVAILNKGELLQQGTVAEIHAAVGAADGEQHVDVQLTTGEVAEELWGTLEKEHAASRIGEARFQVRLGDREQISVVIDKLREGKVSIYGVAVMQRNLEQNFVELVSAANEGDTAPGAALGGKGATS